MNTAIKHCKVHHFANDTNLLHINDPIKKLNKAVSSDLNLRNWLNANKILLYYAIFDCHVNYANTVWGQNRNSMNGLILLQKKALRIMSFECRNAHSNPLFFRHE